jgi:hypothetical protein
MGPKFNHLKANHDAKILQDQSDIKEAHEAWCDVVFAHQAAFYGHMYGN